MTLRKLRRQLRAFSNNNNLTLINVTCNIMCNYVRNIIEQFYMCCTLCSDNVFLSVVLTYHKLFVLVVLYKFNYYIRSLYNFSNYILNHEALSVNIQPLYTRTLDSIKYTLMPKFKYCKLQLHIKFNLFFKTIGTMMKLFLQLYNG